MSNYPPTPAFGGGFTMSRPSFSAPKPNAPLKTHLQSTILTHPYTTRFPGLAEVASSVSNVGLQHTKNKNNLAVEGQEGDREEGEVSDVEIENGQFPLGRSDLQSTPQLNGGLNNNIRNMNGKFVDKSHKTLLGSVDPRKGASVDRYHCIGSSSPRIPTAKTLTAQISALHIREQASGVNNSNTSIVPSHGNHHMDHYHQQADHKHSGPPLLNSSLYGNPYGNSYGNTAITTPYTPQQMEEMRKKAQAAVLHLLPVKMTFKDIVNEGVDPVVLRQVFERIGLPIPSEEVPPIPGTRHLEAARLSAAQAAIDEAEATAMEKAWEEKVRERKKKEKEREATRLILQEKIRKQEQILKEQEQRKKEAERKMKEELERKERERKELEEAFAAAKQKKEEEEERLRAETARKKKEELEEEELKAKKRIVQQKFEEMRLPAKPPTPSISTPPLSSLPPRLTSAHSLPSPFVPATVSPSPPMMIPGLLLDTMDMCPRAPETPMSAPVAVDPPTAPIQAPNTSSTVTSQIEDSVMKDATENRSLTRKKRPVAADFDTEPGTRLQQPKKRFGTLKEGPLIFELTEDEDEDTELDEPQGFNSPRSQGSARIHSQSSRTPPSANGGPKVPERNGKSPPARTSSAANGTANAARQLQDTEEKIRRLREEIQARQEKKRKPSASVTPTGTSTPVRVTTPLEIPGLGTNSALLLPLPPAQLPAPSPLKVSQSDKPSQNTPKIPGLGSHQDSNSMLSSSSVAIAASKDPNSDVNESMGSIQSQITDTSALAAKELETVKPSTPLGIDSSITRQKTEDEGKSQKMREEAERLKLLLLSRRKAAEARQTPTPEIATNRSIPDVPQDISKANDIEDPTTNGVINDNESDSSITEQVAKFTIHQSIEPDMPVTINHSPQPQSVSDGMTVPLADPESQTDELPKATDESIAQITREKSESPPYEPSFDNHRQDSESPPYEPSLGFEDTTLEDKMDLDESDAEEGEILEESVDMEVDSGEDENMADSVLTIAPTSSKDSVSESQITVNGTQKQNEDQPVYKIASISQVSINPILPPKIEPEEQLRNVVCSTIADDNRNITYEPPVSDTKVVPNTFTEYESPLREFRSFRYHPQYLRLVKGGWRSLTFSNRIDPDKLFCVYEISGGKCNDPTCTNQHFRQIVLSDDEILVELGSVMEGDTDAIRNSYRDGLRELITSMRARKVNDFETVAAEISLYRSRFFNDPSRVVRLTKEP